MDCLTGFIGFDVSVQAASGLHLNSLPGITSDLLLGITDDDETQEQTVNQIEKRSVLKFRTFFINELNKCWNVSDVQKAECLICGNKSLLSVSLWYLMGSEVMAETIGSERTNRFTTVDLDKAEKLRTEYLDLFFNELHTAVAGIDFSNCVEDLTHGRDVQVIYTIP